MDTSTKNDIHTHEGVRVHILKRSGGGSDISSQPNSQQADGGTLEQVVEISSQRQFVEPPHDPQALCLLLEHSNALRQNIDAYQTNIDGFGHRFEPVIDVNSVDADDQIANAIYIDRVNAAQHQTDAANADLANGEELSVSEEPDWPTAEEVSARRDELERDMRKEKAKLQNFFSSCCVDTSFVAHRKRTRQDIEVMGNGYWEIIRDFGGRIARITFVPAFTVRLVPFNPSDTVAYDQVVRTSDLSTEVIRAKKRFRRYAQVTGSRAVYFKELGDPRVISSSTGKSYSDAKALAEDEGEGGGAQATELVHFNIHSPRSPYGVPRWMGALLSVVGSRQAEEVNLSYFENKSVPPLALLVSGGRMSNDAVKRIEDYIDSEIKGKDNFHNILVIEADNQASPASGNTKIEIKSLTDAQTNDAQFQNYDERNIDKVGQAFRLPRMLRGDVRDFNKSTAESALVFAEMQVFQPEREDFDWVINSRIIPELGIKYYKFVSNGPVTKDQLQLSEIVRGMVRDNILTPSEGRELASDVFNRDFSRIEDFWAHQAVILTNQGYIPDGDFIAADGEEPPVPTEDAAGAVGKKSAKKPRKFRRLAPGLSKSDDMAQTVNRLIELRTLMRRAEDQADTEAFNLAKAEFDRVLPTE